MVQRKGKKATAAKPIKPVKSEKIANGDSETAITSNAATPSDSTEQQVNGNIQNGQSQDDIVSSTSKENTKPEKTDKSKPATSKSKRNAPRGKGQKAEEKMEVEASSESQEPSQSAVTESGDSANVPGTSTDTKETGKPASKRKRAIPPKKPESTENNANTSVEEEEDTSRPASKRLRKAPPEKKQPAKRTATGKRRGRPDVKAARAKKEKLTLSVPSLSTLSGRLFVLGENDTGQLGFPADDVESKARPAMVDLPQSVVEIAAGGMHSLCLTESGEVLTFGCNDEGALGRPVDDSESHIPQRVNIPERAVQICAGDSHSAALTESGKVYIWGTFRGNSGSMGLIPSGEIQKLPFRILSNETVVKIASGSDHLVSLTNEGRVYTIGCGEIGQLGRLPPHCAGSGGRRGATALLKPDVVPLGHTKHVSDIWVGSYNTFLKMRDSGHVYGFGLNNYGHLGFKSVQTDDSTNVFYKPTPITSFNDRVWSQISGGQHHTLALDSDGKVYCLGRQEYGRLGLGENSGERHEPTLIPTLEKESCRFISAGNCCSFSVNKDGSAYSWGMGNNKQLGHGKEDDCTVPTPIAGKFAQAWKVLKISGGGQHTLMMATPRAESSKEQQQSKDN